MVGFAGVTAMETRVAAVTVRVVEPVMLWKVALIEDDPTPAAVARPPVVIVATLVVTELQVALLVRSCVLKSEKVPVAVNCCVNPLAIEGLAGVTAIEVKVGATTVRVVEPVTPESVALMLEVPVATAVASPAVVIVATLVVAEAHVTVLVRSCVLKSV